MESSCIASSKFDVQLIVGSNTKVEKKRFAQMMKVSTQVQATDVGGQLEAEFWTTINNETTLVRFGLSGIKQDLLYFQFYVVFFVLASSRGFEFGICLHS